MLSFEVGKLEIMGVQETRIKGCEVVDCMMGSESEVWEGMEEGVVWCGVDEKSKGREKERVCTTNVYEDVARHRDTWMEGIWDSVSS